MEQKKTGTSFYSIALLVVGLLLVAGAMYRYWMTRLVLSNSVIVTGTVTAYTSSSDSDGDVWHRPVITYLPASDDRAALKKPGGDDPVTLAYVSSYREQPYAVGSGVEIIYERGNPQNASIHSALYLWGMPIVLAVMGAGFVIGVAVNEHLRREKR